ncbi:MAG: hypothetical protein PHQ52_01010 [Candidatus Omnitrophica bacterium]|nr:hypothetical protein [Candidatus Omnitrophota bacterium]
MNKRTGTIFIVTMGMALIMSVIVMSVSNMVLQDTNIVKKLRYTMQAQYLAEAGINHALAELADIFDLTAFPITGTLSTGNYSVSYITSGGRILLTSTGTIPLDISTTADDVTRSVSVEIQSTFPTSLNYIMSSGNDVNIRAGFLTLTDINGNLHGNNKVHLGTGLLLGLMDVSGTATYSAQEVEIDTYISWIIINGTTYGIGTHLTKTGGSWQRDPVTLPNFDYSYYKQKAIDGGNYYNSDTVFEGQTLTPSSGLIYVDGIATFKGTCNLNGSLIANEIKVESYKSGFLSVTRGKLRQHVGGVLPYDFIVANLGNIQVGNQDGWIYRAGDLEADGALIYAVNDIRSLGIGTIIDVTGSLVAGGDINLWEFIAYITYTHELPTVVFGTNEPLVKIISWNR